MTTRFGAIVLAGGSGSRVGATSGGRPVNKVLLPLAGTPVLAHSVAAARRAGAARIVVVVRAADHDDVRALLPDVSLVEGGAERHDSELAGIEALAADVDAGRLDVIVVHDGARPLAPPSLWQSVVETARLHGGAIPGRGVDGLIALDGAAVGPVIGVQTPQAFRAGDLVRSYRAAAEVGFRGTDTAACIERFLPDVRVVAVEGPPTNLKVTFPEDLARAEQLLRAEAPRSEEA